MMKTKFKVSDHQRLEQSMKRPNYDSTLIQQSIVDHFQTSAGDVTIGGASGITSPNEIKRIFTGKKQILSQRYFNTFIIYFFLSPENLKRNQQHTIEQFISFLDSYDSIGSEASPDIQADYSAKIEEMIIQEGEAHTFYDYKFELTADWRFKITRRTDNFLLYPPNVENSSTRKIGLSQLLLIPILLLISVGVFLFIQWINNNDEKNHIKDRIHHATTLKENGIVKEAMEEYESILESMNRGDFKNLYAKLQHVRYSYYDSQYGKDDLLRARIELQQALNYFSHSKDQPKVDLINTDRLSVFGQLYDLDGNVCWLDSMQAILERINPSNQLINWKVEFSRSRWHQYKFNAYNKPNDLDSAIYWLKRSFPLCSSELEASGFCCLYYIDLGTLYGERFHLHSNIDYLDSMEIAFHRAMELGSSTNRLTTNNAFAEYGLGHAKIHRYILSKNESILKEAEAHFLTTLLIHDSIRSPRHFASSHLMLAKLFWHRYESDSSLNSLSHATTHINNAMHTVKENHYSKVYYMGTFLAAEIFYNKALITSNQRLFQEAMLYAREVKLSRYYPFLSKITNRATSLELLSLYHTLLPSDSLYFLRSYWENVILPADTLIEQGVTDPVILTRQADRIESISTPLIHASGKDRKLVTLAVVYGTMLKTQMYDAIALSETFRHVLDSSDYQTFPVMRPIPGLDEY